MAVIMGEVPKEKDERETFRKGMVEVTLVLAQDLRVEGESTPLGEAEVATLIQRFFVPVTALYADEVGDIIGRRAGVALEWGLGVLLQAVAQQKEDNAREQAGEEGPTQRTPDSDLQA